MAQGADWAGCAAGETFKRQQLLRQSNDCPSQPQISARPRSRRYLLADRLPLRKVRKFSSDIIGIMIRFRCQKCGKKLKADGDIVGRKVKCTRCGKVEIVPPKDNLAKPLQGHADKSSSSESSKRLDTTKPKPVKKKSASFKMGPPDLIASDDSVEMSGHSGTSSVPVVDANAFEPKYKSSKPKKSQTRRNLILALVGLGVVGGIAIVANLGWILDTKRKLSTDYENLEEVKFYRSAASQLERSRRMMKIAGEAYIRLKSPTEEEIKEIHEYDSLIQRQTTKSDMLEKVEALFRAGEDVKAKALLVNTAVELGALKKEVEAMAKEYTDRTY